MNRDHRIFKKNIHFGEAYIINAYDGTIVISGQGQFNTETLKLHVNFDTDSMGKHEDVMLVLKTDDGYFAPLRVYTETIFPMGGNTWVKKMDTFLHWPITKPLDYVVQKFSDFDIFIKTAHETETSTCNEKRTKTTVTKRAVRKELESAKYGKYAVTATATYGESRDRNRVDNIILLTPRIGFTLKAGKGQEFTIRDTYKLLDAFRLFWITAHDYTDGEITAVRIGAIECFMNDSTLKARASNVTQYREWLAIDDTLGTEYLAKLTHFYMNPNKTKHLSTASKVGLSFARMIGYRFGEPHRKIDYVVIDLVFSLQSMLEEIADKAINEKNKQSAEATKAGIEKVFAQIEAVKDELPDNVREFYLGQSVNKVQEFVTRPTFMQSVHVALEKLGIDEKEYSSVIKEINKARQQVVHSQDYNGQFLIDLLTQNKVTVDKNGNGEVVSMAFGIKTGGLDKLYDLITKMIRAYLDQYKG